MPKSTTTTPPIAERIGSVVQQWSLAEPLLFGAWTSHEVMANTGVKTLRCGRGKIEFNPTFLESLSPEMLREALKFEAVRIVLKHPYERKKQHGDRAWQASNLAIQECLPSNLPAPSAKDTFDTDEHDRQFFEYYYGLLVQLMEEEEPPPSPFEENQSPEENEDDSDTEETPGEDPAPGAGNDGGSGDGPVENDPLENYRAPLLSGEENTETWDEDAFMTERIDGLIDEVRASNTWGSLPGHSRELILATLRPQLDYRQVLRAFRASVLSTQRHLTRMKPSRRYGFEYLGSRRDFSTRLLFAVDVSGSVGTEDVRRAFSVINRFFRYGVERIDVLWFDTELRNADRPMQLKRAATQIEIDGRGGTDFQCVLDYLDTPAGKDYDGLILFTDGIAPPPKPPENNHRTKVVWLFNSEANWTAMRDRVVGPGMRSAFLRSE